MSSVAAGAALPGGALLHGLGLEDCSKWLRDELAAYLVREFGQAAAQEVLKGALKAVAGGEGAAHSAPAPAAPVPPAPALAPAPASQPLAVRWRLPEPGAAAADEAAEEGSPSPSDYALLDHLRRSDSVRSVPASEGAASDSGASGTATTTSRSSAQLWRRAVAKATGAQDPWASRAIHKLPMEHCRRYRFNPAEAHWVTDDVLVKCETEPFASGAMRLCFRMKKLSNFTASVYRDWRKAPNFVAKRYKKPGVDRQVYRNDVMLQMTSKALGDDYNKITKPPKKVDFVQAALVEFPDREGRPVFAIEHLIEGDYIKYNSNSGYVSEEAARNTPHAFSHWTYEHTQGRMMVVDIQGVGDLYTDPQIHTHDGRHFGDGNLGLRGYALFFRTHECNALCKSMHLPEFPRCPADVNGQGHSSSSGAGGSGTLFKSFTRHVSMVQDLRRQLSRVRRRGPAPLPDVMLLSTLQSVPLQAPPSSLVHYEVAKLYAETVLLPDIRPDEDPDDARAGGLFHLRQSAAKGCALAQCILARAHADLAPSGTQFAYLIKEAASVGEVGPSPALALRYTQLAAERGVRTAAAALGYAHATGGGVGEGALDGPSPREAVGWLRVALGEGGTADGGGGGSGEAEACAAVAAAAGAFGGAATAPAPAKPDAAPSDGSASALVGSGPRSVAASLGSRKDSMLPSGSDLDQSGGPGATQTTNASAWSYHSCWEAGLADEGNEEEDDVFGSDEGGNGGPPAGEERPRSALMRELRGVSGLGRSQVQQVATIEEAFALLAEAEAEALPGGAQTDYELHALVGRLLSEGGAGLLPDPAAAAEAFSAAAEAASAAFKGKLASRYYEMAAQAEAEAEAGGGGEEGRE